MPRRPAAPAGLSRRSFLKVAGLAAAAACAPAPRPAPASGPVQLVYQDWRTEWFPPMAQAMLEEFHATHPNIRVFYTPDPEGLRDKMPAALAAGTAPDVFQGCCDYFPAWAQAGYLLDLRPYVAADVTADTIADWDPAQYQALFTGAGLQFGLPKYHGALALYFNKDLFDLYQVDYPSTAWTYTDYAEAMRRLTHDQDGDGQIDVWGSMLEPIYDRVQVHVNAWGGHYADPNDPRQCRLTDPAALEAVEWLRARHWDDQTMPTSLAVQKVAPRAAFAAGRRAMVEDGSWALKDILGAARFRIGVAPMPAGPARRATLAATDGYGIFAGTQHPEAAWELLQFLISKEYGRAMARTNFLQPARASLVDEWVGFIQAEYPAQTEGLDLAAFADGHRQGYSVTAEVFHNMTGVRAVTDAAWEEILTLGQAETEPRLRQVCQDLARLQAGAPAPFASAPDGCAGGCG